jgi:putative membrane protein
VAISLIVLAFLLGTQNPHVVKLNYIVASSTLPLATVMGICFFLGIAFAMLTLSILFTKLKWQSYRYRKKYSSLTNVDN